MPRKNPYHPDILIFLFLIPCISAFNYYLTYTGIHLNLFLLLTFSIDTVQGYLAWWAVRSFIIYLDTRLPYGPKPQLRVIVQLIGTVLIGLTIISALTELVSWIARRKPAPLSFYFHDLFIIAIWFFVVNGVYIVLHYFQVWQRSEAERNQEAQTKSNGLIAKLGKQEIRLSFDEIAGFYVSDPYTMACHSAGKKYYLDLSLDKLEGTLPPDFFRLNRQFILHQRMITGFKRAENGKLIALIQSHDIFPSEITISRLKAPAFKSWFRPL